MGRLIRFLSQQADADLTAAIGYSGPAGFLDFDAGPNGALAAR